MTIQNIKNKIKKHIAVSGSAKKMFFKNFKVPFSLLIIAAVLVFFLYALFEYLYKDRVYHGLYLSGNCVGGFTKNQITLLISEKEKLLFPVKIIIDEKLFELSPQDIDFSYDPQETFVKLHKHGRAFYKTPLFSYFYKLFGDINEKPVYFYSEQKLDSFIDFISSETSNTPIYPTLNYSKDGLTFVPGTDGSQIDKPLLKEKIVDELAGLSATEIEQSVENIDTSMTQEEVDNYLYRADLLLTKNIIINFAEQEIEIEKNELVSFLDPWDSFNKNKISVFSQKFADIQNTQSKEPIFKFEDGKVIEFTPATIGLEINTSKLSDEIYNVLQSTEQETGDNGDSKYVVIAEYKSIFPKTKTEDVNTYGIKELVGKGVSNYTGSIPSRTHNLTLAATKFNGILVAPDEMFSFNKTLGDVSKVTGYQQAYIIQDGQTILGDGGGVCQVSTTLFRAILNAGLPVIERKAHSYRVSYYENDSPPGLDATVFSPSPDLKFKNDTGNYILIQTSVDKTKRTLTFDLYGTKDGRVATTTKPVVTSSTPPPEDLYIDDPTLPTGTIKQIDYKAWGAKVVFSYKVERDGETIFEKTFYSNYLPWQAKFLRGTGV